MQSRWLSRGCSICAPLLSACVTADLDETDHSARFYDVRVRKELSGEADHTGAHLELGGSTSEGTTNDLDYSIQSAQLGIGLDGVIAERGWAGVAIGVQWQRTGFALPAQDLGEQTNVGPYLAVQGGWRVTPWLEPYARAEAAFLFRDFISQAGIEAGLRFHLIDHAALYLAWRRVHYNVNDFDRLLSIEQIELDLSGWVFGIELAF